MYNKKSSDIFDCIIIYRFQIINNNSCKKQVQPFLIFFTNDLFQRTIYGFNIIFYKYINNKCELQKNRGRV